jgi:type VII secretion integral membrane protein EccD
VPDGTPLELRAVRSTERYRPVIEDPIDAVAEAAKAAGRLFDEAAARLAGLVGLVAGGVALCAAQWMLWAANGYSMRWMLAGAVGAAVVLAGMWSAARRYRSEDAAAAWAVLWVASAAVVGQAIPVSQRTAAPGLAHLMVSLVGAGVAAVCALVITRKHLGVISAAASLAAVLAVVCGVAEYTELAPSAIAAGVLIAGLTGLQLAPTAALSLARISLPKVPADGQTIPVDAAMSATEIESLRMRARRAVQMSSGFIVSAVVITAASTIWAMDPQSYHAKAELGMAICVAVVLVTWGRTMSNGIQAFSMFAGATAVILGCACRVLIADPTGWQPIVVLTVVAAAMVGLVLVAVVVTPRGVNPIVGRAVEWSAVVALTVVYPLCAWVTGIFGVLRDLRLG